MAAGASRRRLDHIHSGAEALSRMRIGQHTCIVYDDPAELAPLAAGYLAGGLGAGHKCLFIATEIPHDDVRAAMRERGASPEDAEARGQLALLDKSDVYVRDDVFAPNAVRDRIVAATKEAQQDWPAVRGMGEMSFACTLQDGFDKLIEYEAGVNQVFGTIPFAGLCAYQRGRFPAEVLTEIVRVHPFVHYAGRTYQNFFYVPPEEYLAQRKPEAELGRMLENLVARHRLEREQAEAHERHQELVRLKAMMAADATALGAAAHEIANPLQPLRLRLDMLKRGPSGVSTADLAAMERAVERIEAALAELGQTRRSRQGLAAVRRTTALDRLVEDVLDELLPLATAKRVTTVTRVAPGITADVDQVRMVQAVFNLVSNAIKYTPPGGQVMVSLRADGDQARFEVQDTGAGFTQEERARLFASFSRLDNSQEPGTGLGLFITKAAVQQHGGDVWAESLGRGKGSRFGFWIPLTASATVPGLAAT